MDEIRTPHADELRIKTADLLNVTEEPPADSGSPRIEKCLVCSFYGGYTRRSGGGIVGFSLEGDVCLSSVMANVLTFIAAESCF